MSRFDVALDRHFDLVRSFGDSRLHLQLANFTRVTAGQTPTDSPVAREAGAGLADELRPRLARAATFYVTAAMQARWSRAREQVPRVYRLDPWDLIEPAGFAWLERAAMRDDPQGIPSPIRAVSWCPIAADELEGLLEGGPSDALRERLDRGGERRVGVQFWLDGRSEAFARNLRAQVAHDVREGYLDGLENEGLPPEGDPEVLAALDEWRRTGAPEALGAFENGRRLHDDVQAQLERAAPWILDASTSVALGRREELRGDAAHDAVALWLLMAQPVARVGRSAPRRATRRRAERELPRAGDVNVVYLRRAVDRDPALREAFGDVRLGPRRHRVRGHWKRVWVGPRDDPAARHREWRYVEDYERGDGPLVETDRLYVVRR